MCETCGCGNSEGFEIHGPRDDHDHEHVTGHDHSHHHTHDHHHGNDQPRRSVIDMGVDIMAGNNLTAGMNRRFLQGRKTFCINMVSSPGSGKTTILEKTIMRLTPARKIYVIEGDQQTMIDADRIEKAGATAVQINTGSGCHLDAHMVEHALERMDIDTGSILFIENVGNLVCPAMFDLGENRRVLVVSVTEGEDKPLKYPMMFETSHLCLINKSDLLPHLDFDLDKFRKNALIINQKLTFIVISATTGEGMDQWFEWIADQVSYIK